jgi:Flp pilus assembly protein TadD
LQTVLAPQLEQQRKRRRNWLVVAGVLLACVIVAAIQFKSLHSAVQSWRSRRIAVQAEAELMGGNAAGAVEKARLAYQIKPDEPYAVRTAARVQSRVGRAGAAVSLWKQLLLTGKATQADRQAYAEDLLMSAAAAEAGMQIEPLLRERPDDTSLLRLAARWAAAEGDMAGARGYAAKARQLEPTNHEGRLLLAVLQTASSEEPERKAGIEGLRQLGRERTREGLEALRRLASQPDLPDATKEEIIELIKKHPEATVDHRLLATDMEIVLHPELRATLIDAAFGQYSNADAVAKRSFAVWLNGRREFEKTISLLPIEEAFKRKDHLLVVLDAMAALKRWGEIERVLEIKGVPLDEAYREVFLARSAMELGSKTGSEMHWKLARIAADPSPEQMMFVASYAERIGLLGEAEEAWRKLASNAITARPAYEALLRIAERRGNSEMRREILTTMHQRWPRDAAVRNDLAYVNLLAGLEIDESFQAARKLIEESPGSLAHRTTFALGAYRRKDASSALSAYQGLQISWERVSPSQRAVYAAVLGLNGKNAEARRLASAIPIEDLRVEERELIRQWRSP